VADSLTEGPQTFKVIISETANGTSVATSDAITINDTSQAATVGFNTSVLNGEGWQIYSIDGPSAAEFGLNRNGTYYLTLYYNNGYASPADAAAGTNHTGGNGSGDTVVTGDWISPKTSTVGDAYWIKFTGQRNLDGSGAFIAGYDSNSTQIANYHELDGQPITTMTPFDSGWLQLSSLKVIYIQSGTDSAAKLQSLTVQIATDSSGTNVVSTTNIGTFVVSTYTTPAGGGGQEP
jgi:hypothetical protein